MEELDVDLKRAIKYILKHINILSMDNKYTVARILMFRGYDLRQIGNGVYIDIDSVVSNTISDIYQFMKSKVHEI